VTIRLVAFLCVCALGLPTVSLADQTLPRFYLMGGPFGAEFDSSVKLNGQTLGTEIDLEDDLRLDREDTTFRTTGYWRFAPRHRLKFGYYGLERTSTATLDKEIVIGDTVYPVNASISAGWKVETYQLAYSYSVVQGQRGELGLTVGIHWPQADFYLRGEGAIVGGEPVEGEVVEDADAHVPLPVFGVDGRYRILDWLYLAGRTQYFGLEYDKYDGRFLDVEVGLEAWPWSWLGVGLGVVYTDFDFRVDDADWDGRLEYTTRGPHLYLAVEF
jgi:hypothetical protein